MWRSIFIKGVSGLEAIGSPGKASSFSYGGGVGEGGGGHGVWRGKSEEGGFVVVLFYEGLTH